MKNDSSTSNVIRETLCDLGANKVFQDLHNELLLSIPPKINFLDNVWNIIDWAISPGNSRVKNIYFDKIFNKELRFIVKIWILDGRLKKNWGTSSCFNSLSASLALDSIIGARSILTLKTSDFKSAEHFLSKNYAPGVAFRRSTTLQNLSKFLNRIFQLRLNYKSSLKNPAVHGRYGTEEGRHEKLIPNEVLSDLLSSRNKTGISKRDKFFISIISITLATGFRVTELATLPAECILRIDGGLYILHYPRKDGIAVPRPVHPGMAEVVEDAIKILIELTNNARNTAAAVNYNSILDFSKIKENKEALRYMVKKWANKWTAEPSHLMINPRGAWWNKKQQFVDVIGEIDKVGSKVKAAKNLGMSRSTLSFLYQDQIAARSGNLPKIKNSKSAGEQRVNWDTDKRVISFRQLEKNWNVTLKKNTRSLIKDIIDEAQEYQLRGKTFPSPEYNASYESIDPIKYSKFYDTNGDIEYENKVSEEFTHQSRPLLRDKDGKTLLFQHESLLIVEKYALSDAYTTRVREYSTITAGQIIRWLCGEKRSLGTGNAEDSAFNRLKIIDPRSNDIAKFTTHDIRHWLNTVYQKGGLTEDQIALIFNRKYRSQNATYDQTSNKVRTERMKQAVRDGIAVGRVADTYNMLCDFSRSDAESYLTAVTRMVNSMPHGACMLDWSTTPCPHYLSCFSCESEESGPCEHLVVDPRNKDHVAEIEQINKESGLVIDALESQGFEESPQISHFKRVRSNSNAMLKRIKVIELE